MMYKDHCTQSCGLHLGAQVGNWTVLGQQEEDCHEGQRDWRHRAELSQRWSLQTLTDKVTERG